jgi:hypothetical protein
MKRIYMTLGLVGLLATSALAQSSDMQPLIFSPTNGQTLVIDSTNNTSPVYLQTAFINNGPDMLNTGDTIFWSDPFGGKGAILSSDFAMGDTIYISTDTVNISNGPESGPYDWCVTFEGFSVDTVTPAITDPNSSNDETCVSVTFDNQNPAVGISDIFKTNNQSLNVYPNPANDGSIHFKYDFASATQAVARVTDISGRVVLTQDFGKVSGAQAFTLNVAALNAGLYMIELTTDKGKAVSKFSIQD